MNLFDNKIFINILLIYEYFIIKSIKSIYLSKLAFFYYRFVLAATPSSLVGVLRLTHQDTNRYRRTPNNPMASRGLFIPVIIYYYLFAHGRTIVSSQITSLVLDAKPTLHSSSSSTLSHVLSSTHSSPCSATIPCYFVRVRHQSVRAVSVTRNQQQQPNQ